MKWCDKKKDLSLIFTITKFFSILRVRINVCIKVRINVRIKFNLRFFED